MFQTTICQHCGKLVHIAPSVCAICGHSLGAYVIQDTLERLHAPHVVAALPTGYTLPQYGRYIPHAA